MMADRRQQDSGQSVARIVADRIRQERLARGLTLVQFGGLIGLSAANLSKIEMGKVHPTFPNLIRIAEAFGMSIGDLVSAEDTKVRDAERPGVMTVTRAAEVKMTRTRSSEIGALCGGITHKEMSPLYELIHPVDGRIEDAFVAHSGEEFIYVIAGRLRVHTAFYTPVELEAGDSLYLDSRMAHAYCSATDQPARVLVVWHAKGAGPLSPEDFIRKS